MAGRLTTLFIEDNNIRLLVTRGKLVEKWASTPLEPGLVSDGVIIDEAEIVSRIKELFSLTGTRAEKVIAGLSGLNSLYRVITLPELPESLISEAVFREAGRVIPVPLEDVYLAYQMIPSTGEETQVFLAAYPRNATDIFVRTLRKAGLDPYLMDLAPLALCRSLNEPRAIIASARLGSLDIIIMVDRAPQVIRSLPLSAEAESLQENLATITEEVHRTVAFYNASHAESPLDSKVPVFICGELVEAPENKEILAQNLEHLVLPLPLPVEHPEGFPVGEFTINIGLALKEFSLEKEGTYFSLVNFNILPKVYQPERINISKIITPISIIIGVGILVFMGFMTQNAAARTAALHPQLEAAQNMATQRTLKIGEIKKQIEASAARIAPIEATAVSFESMWAGLQDTRERMSLDTNLVVSLLPDELDLIDLNHGGDLLSITGETLSEENIIGYAKSLRDSKRFSVVISIIQKTIIEEITIVEGEEGEPEEEVELLDGYKFHLLLK